MFDLFQVADSVVLCYSNVEAGKRWWIEAFDCKQVPVPADWENTGPSDIALKLPGDEEPTILLSSREGSDLESRTVPIIFCSKLKKAQEVLRNRGVTVGPIQDGGDTQFFEIRDSEGNVIEICTEP